MQMLKLELAARPYVKKSFIREALGELPARTRGAVEYKYQNISAVLHDAGHSWVKGYKPAKNAQQELRHEVLQQIGGFI